VCVALQELCCELASLQCEQMVPRLTLHTRKHYKLLCCAKQPLHKHTCLPCVPQELCCELAPLQCEQMVPLLTQKNNR
jgi:hypothetical protein